MAKTPRIEPRFARIAASIGDPTRARMLGVLMTGEHLPSGEIAQAAGVNPSTASEHLGKLVHEGLIAVEARGRHRYFRVADGDVARALEALSLVAERTAASDKWRKEPFQSLKHARTCYRHLAGELGVRLLRSMLDRRRIVAVERGYEITPAGGAWLAQLGIDPKEAARGERYAYACLDWSERRDHMAGKLATSLLDRFMEKRWLARVPQTRALNVTPEGRRTFAAML
ncbi:MAG TPA: winged helix-turn-helix domain-containing protein [Usitatibacter sp.]|nr:winged helix-turn-helix domain-containing protein [Usitatibacter sp.]